MSRYRQLNRRRRRNPWPLLAGCGLALLLVACAPSNTDSTGNKDSEDLVLASYDGGAITLDDLDAHLASTASRTRWREDLNTPEQLEELVRRLAVQRIVEGRAAQGDIDGTPELQARERDVLRKAAARKVLQDEAPSLAITREELQAYFESQREELERPERRRVYHLFVRKADSKGPAEIRQELEALRQRVQDGESFGQLAQQYSESETRHREGLLGLVTPGQFPEDFDRIVFALEEDAVSQPVFTADGGHLFWVADVLPERRPELNEGSGDLIRQLSQEKQDAALERLAVAALESRGETLLTKDYFDQLTSNPTPAAVLFRVGRFEYRPADFQRAVREAELQRRSLDTPASLLRRIYLQEVMLQYVQGLDNVPLEELEQERIGARVEIYLQRQFKALVDDDEERLRQHYDRNIGRFTRPARVDVSRLRIPLENASSALMGRLEAAVADLDAGNNTLEALAAAHGGQVDRIQQATSAMLTAQSSQLARFTTALDPGEHSPPFTGPNHLFLVRLDQRTQTQVQPFEAIQDRVGDDYLQTRGAELYAQYSQDLLEEANFRVDAETLEQGTRLLARLP